MLRKLLIPLSLFGLLLSGGVCGPGEGDNAGGKRAAK